MQGQQGPQWCCGRAVSKDELQAASRCTGSSTLRCTQTWSHLRRYSFGDDTKAGSEQENEKVAMTSPVRMEMQGSEKIAMTSPVRMQMRGDAERETLQGAGAGERISAHATPMQMEIEGTSSEAAHFGDDPHAAEQYKCGLLLLRASSSRLVPGRRAECIE